MKRKHNKLSRQTWTQSNTLLLSRTMTFFLYQCSITMLMLTVTFANCEIRDENNNQILNNSYKSVVIKNTTPMTSINEDSFNLINNNNKSSSLPIITNTTNSIPSPTAALRMGNELWDGLIKDCYRKPTFSCLQKNIFNYLDKTLNIQDLNITNRLSFTKNHIDYNHHYKYSKEANTLNNHNDNKDVDDDDDKQTAENESRSAPADSPIEEVTNALYGKSVKFAMTHDIELKLPEIMFHGATFKISPRSIEGNGAIVKLELIPKETEIQVKETGRIFKKKIQNFLKNKLLLSFLAILIVVKLIKIKFFWLLPLMIGVGAAKKLLLKILLFMFPALAHIFKLCNYYHSNYHQTKFHHHHHLINHHHHTSPPWLNDHETQYTVAIPNGPELIFTQPPKGHPHEYVHNAPIHQHYDSGWESSGPGLGSEYIAESINRNAKIENGYFKPKIDDAHDIQSWGLGGGTSSGGSTTNLPLATSHNINPFLIEQHSVKSHQKIRPYGNGVVYVTPQKSTPSIPIVTPAISAAQIAAQYDPQLNQHVVQRTQAQVKEALRIQAEQRLIAQQQKILEQQPFVQDSEPIMPKGYDQFYSPILMKIDKIFVQLGFTDDFCKERLVCSMYKNPSRYSPHSNFISAELSRDASELKKPTETNPSVIKFYRLVQAAREGQEQHDCLRLYPQCSINTE